MASFACGAKVELLTKNDADENASVYKVNGGNVEDFTEAARGRGTTTAVRDIFYNTPARMKFLKKDASEGTFVGEVVTRTALSHPEIAFTFLRDGKEIFHTPGNGNLSAACHALFGAGFAKALLAADGETGNYHVHGLVTPPEAARQSRGMQYFFINGRFVKNRTMMAALEQAYRGTLMKGRFPGCVLFLDMPPQMVDVNVHPAKTEVRFAHENEVFDAVYRAVKTAVTGGFDKHRQFGFAETGAAARAANVAKEAVEKPQSGQASARQGNDKADRAAVAAYNGMLQDLAGQTPFVLPTGQTPAPQEGVPRQTVLQSSAEWFPYETKAGAKTVSFGEAARGETPQQQAEWRPPEMRATAPGTVPHAPPGAPQTGSQPLLKIEPQELPSASPAAGEVRVLGEVFRTYIVAEYGESMCLIDKHAAHERLLYEKFAQSAFAGAAQQMLQPLALRLAPDEKEALLGNLDALAAAGIEVEDFGGSEVLVRGVPADMDAGGAEELVTEVAARFAKGAREAMTEKREWVLHSMACRAAMKGGDKRPVGELVKLAEEILKGDLPPFCPHGRPVVLEISRGELEKQFGRLG